jgi:predicted acylesterase/phospholipase RssA
MKPTPKAATPSERRQVERTHPALVLLRADEGVAAPIGALTILLAQSLAGTFGDAVLVVHLASRESGGPAESNRWNASSGPPSLSPSTSIAGPASRTPSVGTDSGGAHRLHLALHPDPRLAAGELLDKIRRLVPSFAYILVDPSACAPALAHLLLEELASPELHGTVRRLVFLTRVTKARASQPPPAFPGVWSVLVTHLLDPFGDDAPPSVIRPRRGALRERLDATGRLFGRLRDRLGGAAIEPCGEPYPESRVIPEQCSVRLDLPMIAGMLAPVLGRMPEPARASFARWARALTWRRVGVALGGSGAWGYAHVALLRQLEAERVPVDIVGGVSSGSVMGSYYCVLGREGLDLAVARGPRFEVLAWLSMLSSTAIDLGADADFGQILLEDLEVMFLPVATNLSQGRAEVITRSTVASAVRASSSAPGIFASTITRSGVYVDGAISDNVPVVLVERMGADLLIACNSLPPPHRVSSASPASPLGDFLAELSPVARLRDLRVSFELMLHAFGDCEPSESRIVYDPPPEATALFGTFAFGRAGALIEAVEREPGFQEIIRRSVEAYKRLAAPRAAVEPG